VFILNLDTDLTRLTFRRGEMTVAGWAPLNGGFRTGIKTIANWTAPERKNATAQDVLSDLSRRLRSHGCDPQATVGMITLVPQAFAGRATAADDLTDLAVSVFATVGLGNALAPGDEAEFNEDVEAFFSKSPPALRVGTINMIAVVNRALTEPAYFELLSVLTQSKAAFMRDLAIPSSRSSRVALGTGTDCVTVCGYTHAPRTLMYAGLHTKLGEVASRAARRALIQSLRKRLNKPQMEDASFLRYAREQFIAFRRAAI
jgi:adenosylcobinamide amidohydrolase